MRQKLISLLFLMCFFLVNSCGQNDTWKYLGQNPPADNPKVFALDIITTSEHEHSAPAISPDGKFIFWSAFKNTTPGTQIIYFVKFEGDKWSEPKVASFSGKYSDGGPCFTHDGNRLYFYSLRPVSGDSTKLENDLWYVGKTESGWTQPENIGLSSLATYDKWVFSPSVSANGNIYITGSLNNVHGLYKIQVTGDTFEKPVPLDRKINSNYEEFNWTPYISPDESYLIFSSKRKDSRAFNDLYISFKQKDGGWSIPINMGDKINNGSHVRFPNVSPDGKYLFFTRDNGDRRDDVYWMDAGIIDELRKSMENSGKIGFI